MKKLFCLFLFVLSLSWVNAQTVISLTTPGNGTFIVPSGVTSIQVECWGGGGAGGGATNLVGSAAGGGGGGAYALKIIAVAPGDVLSYTVAAGGVGSAGAAGTNGGDSYLNNTTTTLVLAKGGTGGGVGPGGAGGLATSSIGTTVYAGGNGASSSLGFSGGGGGAAGPSAIGGNGATPTGGVGAAGGGAGGNGQGGATSGAGNAGVNYGGGGGGGLDLTGFAANGGAGAGGKIVMTYIVPVTQPVGNRGMYFDGVNDKILVPYNASISFGGSSLFTYEVWVKTKQLGSTQTIIGRRTVQGEMEIVLLVNPSGSVSFGTGKQSIAWSFLETSTAVIEANKWVHLAFVKDAIGNSKKIYVNGELQTSIGGTDLNYLTAAAPSSSSLQIGDSDNGSGTFGFFNGQLDEVKIYNIARTASQIQVDMGSTSTTDAGLVAYWNFEDDAGGNNATMVKDLVSGNNGTPTNGPLWALRTTDNTDNSGTGLGSLRQAITEANTDTDTDYIDFSIQQTDATVAGVSTITPTAELTITQPIFIDGYSAYGSSPNTAAFLAANNANIRVECSFSGLPSNANPGPLYSGINLSGTSNSLVRGLALYGINAAWGSQYNIAFTNTTNSNLQGSYIGLKADGTTPVVGMNGVGIGTGCSGDSVGGQKSETFNVISNSIYDGFQIAGTGNFICNNYIGTDKTGNASVPNSARGVALTGNGNNVFHNLISGNGIHGVLIQVLASGNIVQGNYIGTKADQSGALANGGDGIRIETGAINSTIGGTGANEPNIIAYNADNGVSVDGSTTINNKISGNAIYCNVSSGIALTNLGNNNKAAPVILSATQTTISGTCASGDVVEIFKDTASSCGAAKQGKKYLGVATVTGTSWSFSGTFALGATITATATDATNGTSPFSLARLVLTVVSITDFSPKSGAAGDIVTITGSGFSANMADNRVWFGGIPATVSLASTTSLQVKVPAGATYSTIAVENNHFRAESVGSFDAAQTCAVPSYNPATASPAVNANNYVLVAGDFNNDGVVDIATSGVSGNVSILLGKGNGSFSVKPDVPINDGVYGLAMGDLNGDGNLDLVTANYTGSTVTSLLGDGTGTFIEKQNPVTGNGPYAIIARDFDGDGILDIATANYDGGTLSILTGLGDGTFGLYADHNAGNNPYALDAGDLNGDGKLDIAVANAGDKTISVFLGNSSGVYSASSDATYPTGDFPNGIVMGDFNGDSKTDLATSNFNDGNLTVLLNNGTSFGSPIPYSTASDPGGLVTGDLNGDGILDMVASSTSGDSVSVLIGKTGGGFAPKANYKVGTQPYGIAVADLNQDGHPDLATANYGANFVSVLLSKCSISTLRATAATSVTKTSFQVNWTSTGASSYELDVATDTLFMNLLTGYPKKAITDTFYAVTGLTANTVYYYRVRNTGDATNSNTKMTSTILPPGSGNAVGTFSNSSPLGHIEIPSIPEATFGTGDFSLQAWIKTSSGIRQDIMSWGQTAIGTGLSFYVNANGQLEYDITDLPGPASTTIVADNNWHHVALVNSNKKIQLFVDGIPDGSGTMNSNILASSLYFGNTQPLVSVGPKYPFGGQLDEICVWNRAITLQELRENMCQKLKVASSPNIIVYLPLDEGAGSITENKAQGSSVDGILVNTPTWSLSGAAIGDTSVYSYGSGTSLSLNDGDVFTAKNFNLNTVAQGMQVYKVREAPNDLAKGTGIDSLQTSRYFGVFPVGISSFAVNYDYTANTNINGKSYENHTYLARRAENDSTPWNLLVNSKLDIAKDTVSIAPQTKRGEYIPAFAPPRIFGAALDFDGVDDKVVLPIVPALNLNGTDNFTIEAWVKTDINGNASIVGSNGIACSTGQTGLSVVAGKINLYIDYRCVNTYISQTASPIVVPNTWTHVAWVHLNNANNLIYVDGVLQTLSESGPKTTAWLAGSTQWTLGQNNNAYNGLGVASVPTVLDEVRIWHRALCQAEIKNNLHFEKPVDQTGLLARYDFNEGIAGGSNTTVTTLKDSTANGNDGTLNGFALSGTTSNWVSPGGVISGSVNTTVVTCPPPATTKVCAQAVDSLITISWNSVQAATKGYTVIYTKVAADTANPNATFNSKPIANSATVSTSISGLTLDQLYYFALVSVGGDTSNWTAAVPVVQSGEALTFGSGTYLYKSDFDASSITSELTVEAWFKTSTLANQKIVTLSNGKAPNGVNFTFSLALNSDTTLYHEVFDGVTGIDRSTNSTVKFTLNNWHHTAITYKAGSFAKFYLDGNLVGQVPVVYNVTVASPKEFLNIGAGFGWQYTGDIDEVRLWNVERSPSQINSFKDKPLTGTEIGLLGLWHLDEPYGGVAYDATCNSNNLNWVGSPLVITSKAMFPFKPDSLKVVGGNLTWKPNIATDVRSYHIQQRVKGVWTDVDSVAGSKLTYALTATCTPSYYKVVGVDSARQVGVVSDSILVQPKSSLDSGLVAYYPFDGNANDESGNANKGSLVGNVTPTTGHDGKPNSAYKFGGTNSPGYIAVNNSSSLSSTSAFVIDFWARIDGNLGGDGNGKTNISNGLQSFFGKHSDQNDEVFNYFNVYNDSMQLYLPSMVLKGSYIGKWVHYVFEFSNNSTQLFVDGVLVGTGPAKSLTNSSNQNLYLGILNNGGWYPFDGALDDVRVYNRLLTNSEIAILSGSVLPDTLTACDNIGKLYSIVPTNIADASYTWSGKKTATTQKLSFTPLAATDAGKYNVSVTSGCTVFKDSVILEVPNIDTALVVTGSPVLCGTSNVTLAAKTPSDSVVWYKKASTGWVKASKGTSILVTDTGGFYFKNYKGICFDSSKVLKVTRPKSQYSKLSGPVDTTICLGGSVTMTAPTGASSYRWYYGNQLLSGATSNSYSATLSGVYRVIAQRGACSDTSLFVHVKAILPVDAAIKTNKIQLCANDTATLSVSPLNGNSFRFKGTTSSYLENQNVSFPNFKSVISLEGWVKAPSNSLTSATLLSYRILYLGVAYIDAFSLYNPTDLTFSIINSAAGPLSLKSGISIADDKWHHVAVTFSNGITKFYLDGKLRFEGTIPGTGFDVDLNGSLVIGQDQPSNSPTSLVNPFTGEMDELRFWRVELDSNTIKNNYNIRLLGTEPGIIALAHLNDTVGSTIAKEESINHYDLTISNVDIIVGGGVADGGNITPAYTWLKDGNATKLPNANSVNVTEKGAYSVGLNNGFCTGNSTSISIQKYDFGKYASLGKDTLACSGDSLLLSVPSVAGIRYLWSDSSKTSSTKVWKGNYWLKVDSSGVCPARDTISVLIANLPKIDIRDTSICDNLPILLNQNIVGNYNLKWSDGNVSTQGGSYQISTPGKYYFEIDSSSCSRVDTFQVKSGGVVVNLGPDTVSCQGIKVLKTVSFQDKVQYNWSNGSKKDSALLGQGKSWLSVIDSLGCKSSDTINVALANLPQPKISDTSFCNQQQVVVESGIPPNSPYQITWSDNSTATSLSISKAGKYSVSIDSAMCSRKDTFMVAAKTLRALVKNLSKDTTFCGSSSYLLKATSGMKAYQWLKDGLPVSSGQDSLYTAIATGLYSVVQDSSTCSDTSAQVNLSFIAKPATIAFSTIPLLCVGDNFPTIAIQGNVSGAMFKVFLDNVFASNLTTPAIDLGTVGLDNSIAGTHKIGIQQLIGTCASDTANGFVTVKPLSEAPQFADSTIEVCQSESIPDLKLISIAKADTFYLQDLTTKKVFKNTTGVFTSNDLGLDASVPFQSTFSATEKLNGCGGPSNKLSVTVLERPLPPTINFVNPNNQTVCNGAVVGLVAGGYSSYQWYLGDYQLYGATSSVYNVVVNGTYSVRPTTADAVKCPVQSPEITVDISGNYKKPTVSATVTGNSTQLQSDITSGSFQWYVDGKMIVGAKSNSFTTHYSGSYMLKVNYADYCSAFSDGILVYDPSYPSAARMGISVGDSGLYLPEVNWGVGVYPNPFNTTLHVSLPTNSDFISISLSDINGRLLLEKQADSPSVVIETSNLSSGMYLLKVMSSGKSEVYLVEKVK